MHYGTNPVVRTAIYSLVRQLIVECHSRPILSCSMPSFQTCRIPCALILSCALIAPALAQQRLPQKLHGFWDNADPACVSPHSEGRLIISGGSLEHYETLCTIQSLSVSGKDAWSARVRCVDDGGAGRQTVRIQLLPSGKLKLEPSGVSYQRCERRPAS